MSAWYGKSIVEMVDGFKARMQDHENPLIDSVIQCEKIIRDCYAAMERNRLNCKKGIFSFYHV